jgi:hypothetical protein
MTNKELEEKIYEFGQIMYRLGRMETDEKSSTKEYNKFCKDREDLTKKFDEYFKTPSMNKKLASSMGLV